MNNDDKTGMLAIIWGPFLILSALTILFADSNFIVIAVLALAAYLATDTVFDSRSSKQTVQTQEGKRKRQAADGDDLSQLFSLLNEDDIFDLRQRVKQRIMDRIESSNDGELSTLDALLAEQEEHFRNG